MLPHKRGAKSKTLESTQTDKKRERERKREREKERKRRTPSARRTNEEAFAKKAQKTNEKEEEKEGYFSLSVCLVFSLLFSFFFFFRKKEQRNFLQRFFFKGGGGFRANYMRNFFTFARALYRATLYQRERGKDEQHQRILRGKRGK